MGNMKRVLIKLLGLHGKRHIVRERRMWETFAIGGR